MPKVTITQTTKIQYEDNNQRPNPAAIEPMIDFVRKVKNQFGTGIGADIAQMMEQSLMEQQTKMIEPPEQIRQIDEDVKSALVNLGYPAPEAVRRATNLPDVPLDQKIVFALKEAL